MKRKLEDIVIVKKLEAPLKSYSEMKTMEGFYTMIGVLSLKEDNGYQIDVTKIHMNNEECEYLQELMVKNNYRKGKYRHYTKKYLEQCVAWEWLFYSPNTFELDVPKGEIWLEEGWDKYVKK